MTTGTFILEEVPIMVSNIRGVFEFRNYSTWHKIGLELVDTFVFVGLHLVCFTLHDQSFQSDHTISLVSTHRNGFHYVVVVLKVDNRPSTTNVHPMIQQTEHITNVTL